VYKGASESFQWKKKFFASKSVFINQNNLTVVKTYLLFNWWSSGQSETNNLKLVYRLNYFTKSWVFFHNCFRIQSFFLAEADFIGSNRLDPVWEKDKSNTCLNLLLFICWSSFFKFFLFIVPFFSSAFRECCHRPKTDPANKSSHLIHEIVPLLNNKIPIFNNFNILMIPKQLNNHWATIWSKFTKIKICRKIPTGNCLFYRIIL
jgi:hypothetical protein